MENKINLSLIELMNLVEVYKTLGKTDMIIKEDNSNGICHIITASTTIEKDGIVGEFSVQITDYETW